jgi:uncharacterized membrane protein (DUF106 family)
MIYKEYTWIGTAIDDLHKAQDSFRYYQRQQEELKREHDMYDPFNSNKWDKHEWQIAYQYQIADTKWMLKTIQKEIIELKKIIRKLNKEQNKKYNNG